MDFKKPKTLALDMLVGRLFGLTVPGRSDHYRIQKGRTGAGVPAVRHDLQPDEPRTLQRRYLEHKDCRRGRVRKGATVCADSSANTKQDIARKADDAYYRNNRFWIKAVDA